MLFELNNDYTYDMNLNYLNLNKYDINKKNNDEIDLENGFYLGNLFTNTYEPYKNYKSKKVNAYSDRQKLLLRLHELDFILNDLNLFLDLNPNNKNIYEIFKKTAKEYEILKKHYYEKYQILELSNDTKDKYTWINNPWPWDGGYYV